MQIPSRKSISTASQVVVRLNRDPSQTEKNAENTLSASTIPTEVRVRRVRNQISSWTSRSLCRSTVHLTSEYEILFVVFLLA